jgi:hypothetical protein
MKLFSGSGRKCWSMGAGNQDPFPANRGFRAQAGCQRRRRRTKAGYGHPEATLKPPSDCPGATAGPTCKHLGMRLSGSYSLAHHKWLLASDLRLN